MNWKPWMSWTKFLLACATLAYLVSGNWLGRLFAFGFFVIPIVIWARSMMKKQ